MVIKADRFGNPIGTGNKLLSSETVKVDRFGNPIEKKAGSFDSTRRNPKEEEEEGVIEKYIIDPVKSAAFGVAVGVEKTLEGATTLGTILIDAGLGTDLTRKVQKAFDESDVLNFLEEQAEDSWTGTLTSVLMQFGIPGAAGLKIANGIIKAKKAGILTGKIKGPSTFATRNPNLTRALIAGGAEGAVLTEDMGSLGDLIGGPTQLTEDEGETGRREA